MSSRFLQVFIDNASFTIAGTLPVLRSRGVGLQRVLDVCSQYRRRGIARFLQSGRADPLGQDLQRSGAAFAAYLGWADDAGKIVSKSAPFHDAVACGDLQTARTIAQLDSPTLQPDYEYEDDFLYTRILYGRYFLGMGMPELAAMLRRYEALLDGAEDPRFLICQAFVEMRSAQFDIALEQLIAIREDTYAIGIEADDIVEEDWATDGKIFVEGMALVRLAQSVGLPVQRDYLFIPSLAMTLGAVSFDRESWMNP